MLLDATRELLAERGGAAASLDGIARRAGYSRQAVYRHFGSRAGLLKATLADIDERNEADAAVRRVLGAGDAEAVLADFIAWWAGHVPELAAVARRVYADRASDPELAGAWEDRMGALLRACRLVIGRLADEGRLRAGSDPQIAAELLWGSISIPLWDQLTGDLGWSASEYRDRVGALARHALLPDT